MEPVIDLLAGNANAVWHQVEPSVVIRLAKATAELSLNHLTHKRGISLLPSTDVLASAPNGVSADKLDNSAWLLQLLSLIIQILQNSPVKPLGNNRNQTVVDVIAESSQGQNSTELQGVPTNGSSSSSTPVTLTDKLVTEKELLLCLLECLNQCSTDKQGVLGSEASISQEILSADGKISGKATSVEDGVLQLLCVIQNQVADLEVLVDGVLAYLQTSTIDDVELSSTSVRHLSDALLWFLFKLFGSSQAVTQFYEKGEFYLNYVFLREFVNYGHGVVKTLSPTASITPALLLTCQLLLTEVFANQILALDSESHEDFLRISQLEHNNPYSYSWY